MKHVIIGTAGHVDHGKTLLIKALTGIDTRALTKHLREVMLLLLLVLVVGCCCCL